MSFFEVFSHAFGVLPNGTIPDIFMDFKNGVYQSEGENVAVSTLVTENTDFGTYSETDIQAGVGLVEADPVFFGDALSLIISGATIVCTFTVGASGGAYFEMVDSNAYNLDYLAQFRTENPCQVTDGTTADTASALEAGSHKAALTMIDGKLSASIDGGSLFTVNPALPWTPAPQIVVFGHSGPAIESIALYPAQPDADLPALSTP